MLWSTGELFSVSTDEIERAVVPQTHLRLLNPEVGDKVAYAGGTQPMWGIVEAYDTELDRFDVRPRGNKIYSTFMMKRDRLIVLEPVQWQVYKLDMDVLNVPLGERGKVLRLLVDGVMVRCEGNTNRVQRHWKWEHIEPFGVVRDLTTEEQAAVVEWANKVDPKPAPADDEERNTFFASIQVMIDNRPYRFEVHVDRVFVQQAHYKDELPVLVFERPSQLDTDPTVSLTDERRLLIDAYLLYHSSMGLWGIEAMMRLAAAYQERLAALSMVEENLKRI